ncbi:MAG TPA: prolipoprotein diacylglyceryl transferase family protein [Ktedonobacteraceae bacterium]|nr:prolipoprotein diacylglyceryl transferase family protein [Ktedonobacteraceae bacterium]
MVTKRDSFLGKVLYGTLFVLILPAILLYWTSVLDTSIDWPVPSLPILAASSIVVGTVMILKGMLDLAKFGQGLPMNAYPPEKFVTQGMYALFSHPIYLGAVLLSAGTALWFQSSSGLYIVTPILALMTLSLVYGYELPAMEKRFGSVIHSYRPLFSLPLSSENKAIWLKKVAMCIRIFLPWMLVGYVVDYARCPQTCNGAFIGLTDTPSWQTWLSTAWTMPYIYIAVALFVARTEKSLLHKAIAGTLATVVGTYLYIILPAFGFRLSYINWNWAIVSLAVVILAINYRVIWSILQSVSEWIGNSRHDWLFAGGRFRIINHGLYSGLAGAVAVGIVSYVLGNPLAALVLLLCALIGAAVFAQVLWGSNVLARPFGYWGAVLGCGVGILLVSLFFAIPLATVALALVLCAPFAQAIGRLRCLAQGCCHGTVTTKDFGICIWQSQSRVVAISGLKGKYILNTQLYSILFNIPLGFLLWSIWLSQSLSSFCIIALYLIFTGIERFTEDAYRGEKQTRFRKGLRENQWIALGAVLIGICMTMLPTSLPGQPGGTFNLAFFAAAVVGGLLTAFAMSMDFPKSTSRFSRLSG